MIHEAVPHEGHEGAALQPPMANRAWCTDYSCPDWCPQCGNGDGVCGDGGQWGSQSDMLGYLDGPQTTFAPGEVVEFEIEITAHHKGHFEFGLCKEQLSHATAELRCFDFPGSSFSGSRFTGPVGNVL